uniref:Cytochrome P450 n=1 Tax=Dendroctonus armandi TaxID=77159 RepID=A0A0M4HBP5_9CUCU|nr:cytochrome P450 [Dendroctonus armandi]
MLAKIGAIVVFLWFLWLLSRRRLYIASWQLPGPPALLPFIGNGFALMCPAKDLLKQILKQTDPYSSPLRLWIGPRLVTFIKDPDQLQIVMQSSKYTVKSNVYRFLEPFMGKGLFTLTGPRHKVQRKLLQPLFGPRVLESVSTIFQKHALNLVKILEDHVGSGCFDVLHILHKSAFEATVDILLENAITGNPDYTLIPGYVRRFYHIFSQRVSTFWMHSELLYRFSAYYKEQQMMTKLASKCIEEVASQQLPEILKRIEDQEGPIKCCQNRPTPSVLETMVQLFKENPGSLTEEEFKDHMMTFFATSQDTQSSALAFTLMMLGMHQNIQDKVLLELQEVLDGRRLVTLEDAPKLKFMEMCINEAMRLFPVGPFLPRDVAQSFKLGTTTIPEGSSLILGIFNVHRDPKYWQNPQEFYPEHFAEEQVAHRHPYAFLPFSAGPRRCIGKYYNRLSCPGKYLQSFSSTIQLREHEDYHRTNPH